MECKRCLNNDMRYFIKHQDQYLCRKCIMFTAVNKESDYPSFNENIDSEYTLTFQLSPKQKELSKQLNKHVLNNQDVLVYAAWYTSNKNALWRNRKWSSRKKY